jgi:hypothetical protein
MTNLAVEDADCEAFGHPGVCTEPAPGTVEITSSTGITVTVGGTTKEIASIDSADMNFPSHGHGVDDEGNCTSYKTHSIDPDTGEPSITINGSPIYLVKDSVTTDPAGGGSVNILSNPMNTKIEKIP